MSFADALKPMISSIRAIPGQLGLRPYSVSIVVGTWSGAYAGRIGKTESEVAITEAGGQPPKVQFINAEELAVGNLQKGSIKVGPITPAAFGAGTPLENLKPELVAQQTVHAKITGPEFPNGALYKITSFNTDHALHYTLTCEPVEIEDS